MSPGFVDQGPGVRVVRPSCLPVVLFRGPACEWYVLHVSRLYYSGARRASGTSSMSPGCIIQGPGMRVVRPPCLPVVLFRGPACEWYDALSVHLQHSKNVRNWFAQNILFAHPHRFSEYLLECPSSEVGRCEQSVNWLHRSRRLGMLRRGCALCCNI